jgi:hypothetical protein
MNHSFQRLAGAFFAGSLVLVALGSPMTAFAAGPVPSDAAPSDGAMDDGFEGEVVFDPYFISPEPDATPPAARIDAPKGDVARPALTPPATDTTSVTAGSHAGAGVPLLLAALAILSITVVALGRIPVARRR